jgi:diamine N-acetyltransferase
MLSLVALGPHNWRESLTMTVQPERQAWVSSVSPVALMLLAKSYIRPDGQVWFPFALEADGAMVGVLGVGIDDPGAPSVPQTAWLHHVLIDVDAQGRGYGRAAMGAVGRWVGEQHPTVTVVGLCVLPENVIALALYRSLGFESLGETSDGQVILVTTVGELAAS